MNFKIKYKNTLAKLICATAIILVLASCGESKSITVYYSKNATPKEILAAKEIQKYIYVRSGELPEVAVYEGKKEVKGRAIILSRFEQFENKSNVIAVEGDSYLLKSDNENTLFIVGGTSEAVLYGAYKYIESMGVGFMIDGDIIPDQKLDSLQLSGFNETHNPVFALRGIQPFHDFPEGPDWWNEEDYKAVISQLPKMGMNFIGFHTYPEKRPFGGWERAEPMVWIGTRDQFNKNGNVKSAYPVLHSNTADSTWAYYPKKIHRSIILELHNYLKQTDMALLT